MTLTKARICCEICDRRLPLDAPEAREWVPEKPGARARGYRVRPFSLGKVGPAHTSNTVDYVFGELVERRRLADMKGFHNTVMGEAFNDSNARISEEDIQAVMKDDAEDAPPDGSGVFVGIDVGATCHVVLGHGARAFAWHQVPREDLVEFVAGVGRRYRIVQGGIDRYPETEMAERVRDIPTLDRAVMPIGYADGAAAAPVNPKQDEFGEVTHYVVNRTQALDAVQRRLRDRSIVFTGVGAHRSLIVSHLRDMIRIEEPEKPPRWEKLEGNDHFFHALGYMLTAVRIRRGIEFVETSYPDSPVFLLGAQVLKPVGGDPNVRRRRA